MGVLVAACAIFAALALAQGAVPLQAQTEQLVTPFGADLGATVAENPDVTVYIVSYAPTNAPSASPTFAPTFAPTFKPSSMPTYPPTRPPTVATPVPTSAPTDPPSSAPTHEPTSAPTTLPSSAPTFAPSSKPTRKPSSAPTKRPSSAPTQRPTSLPTDRPSSSPTIRPTRAPSKAPSADKLLGGSTWYRQGWKMTKVKVSGVMSSANIQKACNAKGMYPPCDHSHYKDGYCILVTGGWHLSHPHHDRHYGIPLHLVKGTFFYTSNRGRSLYNTGSSHRWSNGNDKNGHTYCASKTMWVGGKTLVRVPFRGVATRVNAYVACQKYNMVPVLDHSHYKHYGREGWGYRGDRKSVV